MASRELRVPLLVGALVAPLTPVTAQRPDVDQKVLYTEVRKATERLMAKGEPAVMVVVVRDGKVLLSLVEGQATKDLPATLVTLFPMGRASRAIANLTFAALAQQRRLDLDKQANECIAPLVLQDRHGKPSQVSLRDVLRGKCGLPTYRNLLPKGQLARWSLSQAVADQGRAIYGSHESQLDYGVLQLAAEKTLRKPWADIVKSTLSERLKLRRVVADACQGLPRTAAQPYRKKNGRPREVEPCSHSHVSAANGAWIDAPDMGRLLLHLLHVSREQTKPDQIKALVRKRIEFNRFRIGDEDEEHCHLAMQGSMPGMSGGMRIYPQHRTAFAVFTSMSRRRGHAMPNTVLRVVAELLLPPQEEPRWNTAIGLGGGAGTALRPPRIEPGQYFARLPLHGMPRKLRAWFDKSRNIERLQFADRPSVVARSKRGRWGSGLELEDGDLLQLRPDLRGEDSIRSRMALRFESRDGKTSVVGTLHLDSPYFKRSYHVRFEPVMKQPVSRLSSRPTAPEKR